MPSIVPEVLGCAALGGGQGIMGVMTKHRKQRDQLLFSAEAREIAREVITEAAEGEVGEHLGVKVPPRQGQDSGHVAIHRFASLTPGYKDWEWIAVLAAVPGSQEITVNEVALQAGAKAELAPEWVPYEDRVRPGDLGPGDTLPPREDDERLASWDELAKDRRAELENFPRNQKAPQALSAKGLADTLQRWRKGNFGPNSEFAEKAAMSCKTCAFYLPINNPDTQFGMCTNEYSADGRVVHATYGCGAHSETKEEFDSTGGREYGAFDDGI